MKLESFYTRSLHAFMEYCFGRARAASRAQVDLSQTRVLQRLRQDPMWESEAPLFDGEVKRARRVSPILALPAVAATILAVIVGGLMVRDAVQRRTSAAVVETDGGSVYRVDGVEVHPFTVNERIAFGDLVRSNGGAGGMLLLTDGSRVEMRSRSELTFERADDGVRIRLGRGGIIVNAAKQRDGHLYVQTRDVTVSVVGTVFIVNAEEQGSRVAVIEGEVRVQQGATEQKLLSGQQLVTSPLITVPALPQGIAWSRNAESLRVLLQQSAVAPAPAPQRATEPRVAFEVVSIRMRPARGGGGGARGGGAPVNIDDIPFAPCRSVGPTRTSPGTFSPQLDPERFAVTRAGLLWLISKAYGPMRAGCDFLVAQKLLSEGPDWVRTTEFDIEARLPPGTPAYTARQLDQGQAPEIQRMLQTMLAERFKLVLKREAREMPVYVLSVAPGGPKLTLPKERPERIERDGGVNPANPSSMAMGPRQFPDCVPLRRMIEEGVDGEDVNRCRRHNLGTGTVFGNVEGNRVSMDQLTSQLQVATQRPVINRTGIPGVFDYDLVFAPALPWFEPFLARFVDRGQTILSSPSLFKALEDQMGLRLEPSQDPVEAYVIERVETPTPN